MAAKESSNRITSVKVGEVPMFFDSTNPRLYRRMLCDWVAFQDLGDDATGKKLTRGQQVFAIITNIRGNAGLRMSHIPSLLSKTMTRQEFMNVVDHILDIVDPVDKEASFLQTARAWRDLMQKSHRRNQTYDKYWTEFSSLCLNYAYCHGEPAQTSGVQELLALLCILNAQLPRAEFGIVLQSAMQFQKEQEGQLGFSGPMRGSQMLGPSSASRAMSYYSSESNQDPRATAISADQGIASQGAASGDGSAGAGTSSAPPMSTNTGGLRTQVQVHAKIASVGVEAVGIVQKCQEITHALGVALEAIASLPTTEETETAITLISGQLQYVVSQNDLNQTSAGTVGVLNDELAAIATANRLAYKVARDAPQSLELARIPGESLSKRREDPPLISLEAVRMALRRVDHGDRALKTSGSDGNTAREDHTRKINFSKTGQVSKKSAAASSTKQVKSAPPHIQCYVCTGNHFYYQVPECKEQYDAERKATGRGTRPRLSKTVSWKDDGDEIKPPSSPPKVARATRRGTRATSALSSTLWSDAEGVALTKMDTNDKSIGNGNFEVFAAIVDGGASTTVIRLQQYMNLSEEQGVKPELARLKSGDFRSHAFGTVDNHSKLQDIVGRCSIPLRVGKGDFLQISALVVDGDVPFVIGKDSLREHGCLESHDGNWIEFDSERGRVRISSFVSPSDGHARIRMCHEDMQANFAEGMLHDTATANGDDDGDALIRRIHARTHLHPKWLEALLKRAKKWTPGMLTQIALVQDKCMVCRRSGDPPPARKFSLARLDAHFNDKVYVDVFYWGRDMVLHMVDYSTGYSELGFINSRNMQQMLRTIQNCWILRHGDPLALFADAEFDRRMVHKWASDLCIKFVALPARRHNKAGCVERKNRVVKDVLEKLDNDELFANLPIVDRLAEATFVSNVLYGNRVASSFELVRGYTPSIAGSGMRVLPENIRAAHDEMVARRLLAKVLHARPSARNDRSIAVGDKVLVLLPGGNRRRGRWIDRVVKDVRHDGAIVVGTGRERSVVAPEDVRTLPKNVLADTAVRASLGAAPGGDNKKIRTEDVEDGISEDAVIFASEDSSSDDDIATNCEESSHSAAAIPIPPAENYEQPKITRGQDDEVLSDTYIEPTNNAVDGGDNGVSDVIAENDGNSGGDGEEQPTLETPVRRSRAGRPLRAPRRLIMLANPLSREETRQSTLVRVQDMIGGAQFMCHEMPYIPHWIYEEANIEEIETNWSPNIVPVPSEKVPDSANVISSHMVYKVKTKEDGSVLYLKARLCVHGNRDDERESLRTDAAVVSQNGFRLLYSTAVTERMVMAKADIRGAYTQSGIARRDVYVMPPRNMQLNKQRWLLKATMYGLVSAGRKWQRASDCVMLHGLGLSTVLGIPQLFIRSELYAPHLLVAKYVDDLVVTARNDQWLQYGKNGVERAFELSAWDTPPTALFINATEVTLTNSCLTANMGEYLREIELPRISPPRRKQPEDKILRLEMRQVKSLAGKLGYLGVTVSPFATFAASFIQQMIPEMTVSALKKVNGIVRDVLRRMPVISYLHPTMDERENAVVICFSDAGFPHHGELRGMAQEAGIVGIAFGTAKGALFHALSYQSRKQRRVSTSSAEAETIAAVSAFGCARAAQNALVAVYGRRLPLVLVVDSKGLHRCLATQSTPRDSGMMGDVHKLRMAYEAGDIDDLVWVPGIENPADAMTKPHTGATADSLEYMLVDGRLPVAIDNRRDYGPALKEEA